MNIEELREYCLSKKGSSEGFPFDLNTLVFKVGEKMFALVNIDNFEFINLKCDPEKAIELRAEHAFIEPGYHMSKKHWNSVKLHTGIKEELLLALINHSYDLVYKSLSKKIKDGL